MRTILLPFDGSDNAMRAVIYAASLAQELLDTELVLLHVLDPVTLGEHADLPASELERLHGDDMARVLAPAQSVLDQTSVRYQTHCRSGAAANQIAKYAREAACDAIFMGTRGMSPIASLLVGSVATRVLNLAEVPLTLIK